jgi:hypothetical protein
MYKTLRNAFITSLFIGHGMMAACGSGGAQVDGSGTSINRTKQALSLGSAMEINGMYGPNCAQRSGEWSVGLIGFGLLTNSPLSVVMNDPNCKLLVTSMRFGSSQSNTLYAADAPIQLDANYQTAGSPFRKQVGDLPSLYANFRIQPDLSFSRDFSVQALYSDDPGSTALISNADFVVASGTALGGNVPAPDYSAFATGLHFQVDAGKIVQSVSGQMDLSLQQVYGQTYVIDSTLSDVSDYSLVDAAFLAGTPQTLAATDPNIPAAEFGLVGYQLQSPVQRNVIIANEVAGVRSYQIITISFSAN